MPSPERAIAEMVTTKWAATAQLGTDVAGGLHWELYQAPSDGSATTRPYCVFEMPMSSKYKTMAGTTQEVVVRNVKFKVYGKQSEVSPAVSTIRSTFNRVILGDITGATFNSCTIADGGEAVVEMWQRDGDQVWRGTIVFKITVTLG